MHLVADLASGLSDVGLEKAAIREGIVVRAMSRLYRASKSRSALMLRFAGYPRQVIRPSAGKLARIISKNAEDR